MPVVVTVPNKLLVPETYKLLVVLELVIELEATMLSAPKVKVPAAFRSNTPALLMVTVPVLKALTLVATNVVEAST